MEARARRKTKKGPRADPHKSSGQTPTGRTRGVWLPSPSSSLPNGIGVGSGVPILGSRARSEPRLIALPGKKDSPQ